MRKGNSSNFPYGPDRWVSVPGAFKLEHLQPVEPILLPTYAGSELGPDPDDKYLSRRNES